MNRPNDKPVLVLLDSDEGYAAKLTEYMNDMGRKRSFPFEACAFTDMERFQIYAKDTGIAVLLVDEDMLHGADRAQLAGTANLCYLLESRSGSARHDEEWLTIARYQSADHLIEELLAACAQERQRVPGWGEAASEERAAQPSGSGPAEAFGNSKDAGEMRETVSVYYGERFRSLPSACELIGIYSPVGRCGKTGFALTLGEILAEKKRTIYLNLERYSGLKDMDVIQEGGGDINDLIYFYRLDENSLVFRLSSLIRSFLNLDYIAPALAGEDVMSVNGSEWSCIISALAAAGEYEAVVLDLGVSLEDAVYLMSICDRVYMPVLDDRVSAAKTAQFFEAAGRCGAGDLRNTVTMLRLPVIREEIWGRDVSTRLVRGKMGAYVRRLLEKDER